MFTLTDTTHATGLLERRGHVRPFFPTCEDIPEMVSWRKQAHLNDDVRLLRRLRVDELDIAEVRACFAGRIPMPQSSPPWLDYLACVEIRSKVSCSLSGYEFPFAAFIAPFVEEALDKLNQRLTPLAILDVHTVFGPEARYTLGKKLFDQAARVLVSDMHTAREHGDLRGDTPEERYNSYITLLTVGGMSKLLQQYPVLARLLATASSNWIVAAVEMAQRLQADRAMLSSWLGCEISLHTLHCAAWGFGDPHHQGRTGWQLNFTSCSLIYKPRSLTIEHVFQQFVEWVNTKGASPRIRMLDLRDRDQYGWVEFLSPRPCVSIDEVERYFHRLGALICLVHLLDGTDCHSTNIFAFGEYPMLIDLEGLFHPRLHQHEVQTAVDAALRQLSESPLRTGLLPVWQWGKANCPDVDISGVGAAPDQTLRQPVWEQPYTDRMRLGIETYQMGKRPNHVLFMSERVQPEHHVDTIINGFLKTWNILLKHRQELRHASGPLANFIGCQTRLIFQNTATYQTLQDASLHPTFLRNGVQRDVALDRLWITASDDPCDDALLASAEQDMWHGDIPYFGAIVGSRDIITNRGILKEALDASSMNTVLTHVDSMTSKLGEQHATLIRSSLATLTSHHAPLPSVSYLEQPKNIPNWLEGAHSIGKELLASAIRHPPGATWIGLILNRGQWHIRPLPATLYDGLSGIILFLAYLAQLTNESSFVTLCDEALYTLRIYLDEARLAPSGIGAFTGWASLLYLYTHINAIRNERAHQDMIDHCLEQITKQIGLDQTFDWIDGAAGCAAVLLGAYQQTGTRSLLDLAVRCGEHLLHTAKPINGGMGWIRPGEIMPLTGLAHGTSGIAVAFVRLFKATGNSAFREAACKALYYERSIYNPLMRNWPDLRNPTSPTAMTAWCHGAVGIGMARLELIELDEICATETDLALHAVRTTGWGREHCLCHGDLGNLDLLLQTGHIEEAHTIAASILGNQPPSSLKSITPSLLLGLAGIGYGLLRLAAPDNIPSPLMLTPPIAHTVVQLAHPLADNFLLRDNAYRFYGHLQENAVAICHMVESTHKAIHCKDAGVTLEDIVPIYNKTALDLYRAGNLERAFHVCHDLLTILDMPRFATLAEKVTDYRPTCLLNFARLRASQGECMQARPYFDMLAALPEDHWDILLTEIACCYHTAGACEEGLAYLSELQQSRNIPYNDPDLLRAQAFLHIASNPKMAWNQLTSINLDKLTPINQCWLLLEKAATSTALSDSVHARDACTNTAAILDQLQATSPDTASMPLLIALGLAGAQAKLGDIEDATTRVRDTAARAASKKLEAIFLRSGTLLCSLLTSAHCRLDDHELNKLLATARVSRYRLEVMRLWASLGKNLVYTGRNNGEREAGVIYLSRVVLEDTQDQPIALNALTRNAAAELRQLGCDPIGEPWCFANTEPQILSDAFRAVIDLTGALRENLHAII